MPFVFSLSFCLLDRFSSKKLKKFHIKLKESAVSEEIQKLHVLTDVVISGLDKRSAPRTKQKPDGSENNESHFMSFYKRIGRERL